LKVCAMEGIDEFVTVFPYLKISAAVANASFPWIMCFVITGLCQKRKPEEWSYT